MIRFAFALLCILLAASASADTVFLSDGSRLHGDVRALAGDRLIVETGFAGRLEIQADAVEGISSEEPLVVTLATGDRLTGRLRYSAEEGQRLESDLIGTVAFEKAQLLRLWRPGETPPELAEAQREIAELKLAESEAVRRLEEEHAAAVAAVEDKIATGDAVWTGRIDIGLSGTSGNSDRLNFNGKAAASRETEFDRLDLSIQGRFASQDGEQTQNETIAQGKVERDFTERWFAFGDLSLERDEFEDLDLRMILSGGVGYFLIDEKNQQLKPRLGLGYQLEAFEMGVTDKRGLVSLGYDYRVRLNQLFQFTHAFSYLPSFSGPTSDYRLESDAGVDLPIGEARNWKLRFGVRNQFDSEPQPGNEKLDTYYTVSIGYDFQ